MSSVVVSSMYKAVGSIPAQQTNKTLRLRQLRRRTSATVVVTDIGVCVLGLCLSLWAIPPFSKHLASLKDKNKVESIKVI